MLKKQFEFLNILCKLTNGAKSLVFTEYFEVFIDEMRISLYNILCIYALMVDKGYIKYVGQGRVCLTEKALNELNYKIVA